MLMKTLSLMALLLVVASIVSAQDEPCLEPSSYALNEIALNETSNLGLEIANFRRKVEEMKPEQAIAVVFGGRRSKVNEVPNLIEKIERELGITKTDYQRRYWVRDGGFRLQSSVVFLVRPLKCSDYSIPLPDFSYDQVEFEGFDAENTVITSSAEFWSAASHRPKPQCPPAARAVRACTGETPAEVYILVDRDGKVVFAKTIGGHPLIRAAAEVNVKSWKLKPLMVGERSMNRSGIVRITFEEGPDITSN